MHRFSASCLVISNVSDIGKYVPQILYGRSDDDCVNKHIIQSKKEDRGIYFQKIMNDISNSYRLKKHEIIWNTIQLILELSCDCLTLAF